jgi:hypothetical protein
MHVCKLHHDVAWALAGAPVPRPGAHGSVCTPPRRSACRAAPPEQPQQQPPAASPAAPAATGGKGGMALNEGECWMVCVRVCVCVCVQEMLVTAAPVAGGCAAPPIMWPRAQCVSQHPPVTACCRAAVRAHTDMLAQLRSAQEEAARLKRELEVLQQQRVRRDGAGRGGACVVWPQSAGVCFARGGHDAHFMTTPPFALFACTVAARCGAVCSSSTGWRPHTTHSHCTHPTRPRHHKHTNRAAQQRAARVARPAAVVRMAAPPAAGCASTAPTAGSCPGVSVLGARAWRLHTPQVPWHLCRCAPVCSRDDRTTRQTHCRPHHPQALASALPG